MPVINPPGLGTVDAFSDGKPTAVSPVFRNFFNQVYNICFALTQSGTTADRPTTLLWEGRMYMDLTLGIPIWYTAAGWVDATGSLV